MTRAQHPLTVRSNLKPLQSSKREQKVYVHHSLSALTTPPSKIIIYEESDTTSSVFLPCFETPSVCHNAHSCPFETFFTNHQADFWPVSRPIKIDIPSFFNFCLFLYLCIIQVIFSLSICVFRIHVLYTRTPLCSISPVALDHIARKSVCHFHVICTLLELQTNVFVVRLFLSRHPVLTSKSFDF